MKLFIAILVLSPLACVAELAALADVVTVGVRPYFLLDQMKPSSAKDKLGTKRILRWDLLFV